MNACKETQTGYIRCLREMETSSEDLAGQEQVRDFLNLSERQPSFLSTTEGKILITTGSKELKEYTKIGNYQERCFARVLSTKAAMEESVRLGFEGKHLIAMQGPFSEEMNLALLHQTRARYFVTKESGKAGGFEEKLKAARDVYANPDADQPAVNLAAEELSEAIANLDLVNPPAEVDKSGLKDAVNRAETLKSGGLYRQQLEMVPIRPGGGQGCAGRFRRYPGDGRQRGGPAGSRYGGFGKDRGRLRRSYGYRRLAGFWNFHIAGRSGPGRCRHCDLPAQKA